MTESITIAVECPVGQAIVRTLLYFETFSYPLSAEEVFHFSDLRDVSAGEISKKLEVLVNQQIVYCFEGYYQTQCKPEWVTKRLDCNRRAASFLPVARRMARLIGSFPYIRGVFVSGSLSKHCMRADSDIDFFIVTEPGRLWLGRTLLVVFKKIFLLNSHKYFCVNYFIDTNHLEIEEKNLFTATETVTLLPVYGKEWYHAFCAANTWANAQFPHFPKRSTDAVKSHSRGFLKRISEWLLNGKAGDWLDQKMMRITLAFWHKKFGYFEADHFELALKSRRYVSKHHPLHFQEKVLKRFANRLNEMKIQS